ncbi:MAG: sigma-70 family RNA polymerase sigma factor [Pseudomonadota bacterium]
MSPMIDPDQPLLARIATGDRAAFSALHARHATRVFRFLMGLTRAEPLAEDLTNETFIEVWRKAGSFQGRAKVGTWILTIARNKALSQFRKRAEEPWDADAAAELADDGDTGEIALAKQDKADKMRACIAALPPAMREVVDLVYYQEKSVADCAEILGIPQNTVKTRMFHARKKLGDGFRRAGIDRGWP